MRRTASLALSINIQKGVVLVTQWYNYLILTLMMAGKKREFSDLSTCDPCDDANIHGIVSPLVHSHLDLTVSVLYLLISPLSWPLL